MQETERRESGGEYKGAQKNVSSYKAFEFRTLFLAQAIPLLITKISCVFTFKYETFGKKSGDSGLCSIVQVNQDQQQKVCLPDAGVFKDLIQRP